MRHTSRKSSIKPSTTVFGSPSSSSSCSWRKMFDGSLPASISALRPRPNLFNECADWHEFFLSFSKGCTGIARHRQYLGHLHLNCSSVQLFPRTTAAILSREHRGTPLSNSSRPLSPSTFQNWLGP